VSLKHRLAHRDDLPALRDLVTAAIEELQRPFLTPEQIAASHVIMGVDSRLIDDGTYFVVECDGVVAGCGGWSRRATLVGGDHTAGRDDRLLDPAADAARVRAMYTHPCFTRRGIGRLVLERCEAGAAGEGFCHLELVATMAGQALFRSFGFEVTEAFTDTTSGTAIPLLRMTKSITPGLPTISAAPSSSAPRTLVIGGGTVAADLSRDEPHEACLSGDVLSAFITGLPELATGDRAF